MVKVRCKNCGRSLMAPRPGTRVTVYDNGGKTADRYTIVIGTGPHATVLASGQAPFHPQGFGQYAGELGEKTYLYGRLYQGAWGPHPPKEIPEIGKRVDNLDVLPKDVLLFIRRSGGHVHIPKNDPRDFVREQLRHDVPPADVYVRLREDYGLDQDEAREMVEEFIPYPLFS